MLAEGGFNNRKSEPSVKPCPKYVIDGSPGGKNVQVKRPLWRLIDVSVFRSSRVPWRPHMRIHCNAMANCVQHTGTSMLARWVRWHTTSQCAAVCRQRLPAVDNPGDRN